MPGIPLILAALWSVFLGMLGTIVGRVLVSLAFGYVTYTGVQLTLDWAKAQFLSGMSALPASAIALAGTMKIGVCVSMLLSAVVARMVLQGLTAVAGGSITRMVVK